MRNKRFFPIVLIVFLFASFLATAAENPTESKTVKMPDDVKAIIEKSCFGCHNTDSKNDKAKEKLDLKTIDSLTNPKMISALKEIAEVIDENEMPPAKFLEKFPDKKLTDAEKKTLMDWANNEAKSLMK
ncbi:MAG TPA: heme-binding domain-containing protein [Draconibacterium sp.]|nr:heme-binding domain-containing protein [Draconibacterium sp.]